MNLSLSEVRHKLVLACQDEYDQRIERDIHPYTIASYHFNSVLSEELEKYVDTSDWKADNWRELNKALNIEDYDLKPCPKGYSRKVGPRSMGLWAVSAILNSIQAWATPGFAEAYRYHSIHGG
jgi:hypothetical protein